MDTRKITMYTSQTAPVLETIKRDGISYVREEYIDRKYQDTAWIFKEAYHFFNRYAMQVLKRPSQAESAIWVFHDSKWAMPDQNSTQLKLSIPLDEIILFDMRKWNRILNLNLIGTREEEENFAKELERWGVRDPSDVFSNAFYPVLKSRIRNSWEKLFEDSANIMHELQKGEFRKFGNKDTDYIQGAVWYLKQEWIDNKSVLG